MPEPVVRRRFWRGSFDFGRLCRSDAMAWRLYDGSVIGRKRLIAHGVRDEKPGIVDADLWSSVRKQTDEGTK